MEYGTNRKRLRVVWLFHLAKREIKIYSNTPQVYIYSQWIYNLIESFQTRKDVELHITTLKVLTNRDSIFYTDPFSVI